MMRWTSKTENVKYPLGHEDVLILTNHPLGFTSEDPMVFVVVTHPNDMMG